MKIVIYTQNHEPGGGNRYLTDFINAIDPNIEITLIYNRNGLFGEDLQRLPKYVKLIELDVDSENLRIKNNIFPISILIFKAFRRIPVIRNILIKKIKLNNQKLFSDFFLIRDFDIAIAFNGGFPAALSCFDFLEHAKQKACITAMSIVSMPANKKIQKIYLNSISKIDYFMVNCMAIKEQLVNKYEISPKKFEIIYNCTDLPESINKLNTEIGESLRFGFVGRLEKQKGVDLLINSFEKAIKLDNKISLFLYGKKRLNRALEKIAIKSNGKIVIYGPFENAINEVYPNIDILVLPSFWEGFPYVIIEAMSFGCPVIATNVGGISELVNSKKNGCLIEAKNSHQLIESILELSRNRKKLTVLGLNARKDIEQGFTPNIFKNKVNHLISVLKTINPV